MNNVHRPFHIYDGHTYFVTGRCYKGVDYFYNVERKGLFQKKLGEIVKELDIGLFSWVILNNHYHILFKLNGMNGVTSDSLSQDELDRLAPVIPKDSHLVKFVTKLHSVISKLLNEMDNTPGRKIWYQYFDYCLRNEQDFWKHFNYIIKNPFKHGLVVSLHDAYFYQYSSNPIWLKRFGVEGLNESFVKYPVEEVFIDD
ncbi:MAG: hypothetical protein AUJ23_04130 [Candidatus Magasanikbacteria bacterium CG1_02_32_51]|uniref:Transposase IS200-like domain-containing protein n=1 Tax=Candidatus Magasanikbacteria bacterium CG1_02_32_51 TaxID=1805238 RepID=A0A1J4U4R1_9BACT|nr:MAG: hypothetical protein AUJ23_04130 [Candidatus Magasanikbacteria bacterium CG1_02_32_51]